MFRPRSRARFSAKTPAQLAAASIPMLADVVADDADYTAFYGAPGQGPGEAAAFFCVNFSFDGSLHGFSFSPPKGYQEDDVVPDGILDDRTFSRGYFAGPFDFQMNDGGQIVARGLSPDITIRELSTRLLATVSEMREGSGHWKAGGSLNVESEEAVAMAAGFKEVRTPLPLPVWATRDFSPPFAPAPPLAGLRVARGPR